MNKAEPLLCLYNKKGALLDPLRLLVLNFIGWLLYTHSTSLEVIPTRSQEC